MSDANFENQSLLAFWFLMSKHLFFSGHRNVCRSLHTKGLNLLTKEESRGKKGMESGLTTINLI